VASLFHSNRAIKSKLLFIADRAELRFKALQIGMDLIELPTHLASSEGEESGAVMFALQDPSGPSYHADIGEAIIA